jgi:hypothetical protein
VHAGPRALFKHLLGRMPTEECVPRTAAAALYQTLAAKKLSRAREYAAIYPEACLVFIGDNGQVGGGACCCVVSFWFLNGPGGQEAQHRVGVVGHLPGGLPAVNWV